MRDRSKRPGRKFAWISECMVPFCQAKFNESCVDHRGWPVSFHMRRIIAAERKIKLIV